MSLYFFHFFPHIFMAETLTIDSTASGGRNVDAAEILRLSEKTGKSPDEITGIMGLCRQLADGIIPDSKLVVKNGQ